MSDSGSLKPKMDWSKFVQLIAIPIIAAISMWLWKLDDRQLRFATEYATKIELQKETAKVDVGIVRLRDDMSTWLARIEDKLDRVVERQIKDSGE